MNIIEKIFNKEKAIIGMIHLPPLPGTPAGREATFGELAKFATKELDTLENGGVDGIIVENYWDMPYFPNEVPKETIASLSAIAGLLSSRASVPLGINVLYNDFLAEIAIARAVNASFIRAEVFVDTSLSETGIIQPSSSYLVRKRAEICADNVAIFADIHGKNTVPLWKRSIAESAHDAENRAKADTIIITGKATGKPVSPDELLEIRKEVNIPVLIGSGVTAQSIASLFKLCDGVIIGSYFKFDGNIENPSDIERVRELVSAARYSI